MSHGYIYGYKKAADILVKRVNKTAISQDYLIYPIVFLYRQHIELILKNLIHLGRELYDEGSGYPTHHKINDLWPIVKGYARKTKNNKDHKEFSFIEHIIKELSDTDPQSMSFRYAKDKYGEPSNPKISQINIRHFGETINEVSEFLETLEFCLNALLEGKYDAMQSEL